MAKDYTLPPSPTEAPTQVHIPAWVHYVRWPFPYTTHLLYGRILWYIRINGRCFTHQKTLAKDTGLSERTIKRGIKELIDGGWLVKRRVPGKRGNEYYATYPKQILSFIERKNGKHTRK